MADTSARRSPLAHRATELAGLPIGVRELPFLTQLNLRLDADAPVALEVGKVLGGPLPTVPCTASRFGEVEVLWLGPDEWLVLAPAGGEKSLAAALREAIGPSDGAVTDVSAQRTAVELTGARVREVLAEAARSTCIRRSVRSAPACRPCSRRQAW